MTRDTPFTVTEWEWFKLTLELYSLKYRSEMYSVFFEFELGEQGRIECLIYGKHAEVMIEKRATKKEQLEYYRDWVQAEKRRMREALVDLPVLRKDLSLDRDVVFKIMYHGGMGGVEICDFIGKKILWKTR